MDYVTDVSRIITFQNIVKNIFPKNSLCFLPWGACIIQIFWQILRNYYLKKKTKNIIGQNT